MRFKLLIVGLLAVCSTTAVAADLSGQVTAPGGQPAVGARVYVEGLLKGAVTNAQGRFSITGLAPGMRTMVVESLGSARARIAVTLSDAQPAKVVVQLQPNGALVEAARRYQEPLPEHLAQKQSYLGSLKVSKNPLPNIVIFLFDDLGWGDLSSYGNRLIRTPHIDQLAREGVRMTEFYSASPVCTPSRAALLTGRYPQRALAANHVFFPDKSPGNILRSAAGFPNALIRDEILLPEVLGQLGYRTVMTGKWHLGDRAGHLPNDFGFTQFHGVQFSNDMNPLNWYHNRKVKLPAAEVRQEDLTRLIADAAIAEIQASKNEPLFLYVPFTAPHVPHAIGPALAGKSEGGLYGDVVEEADAAIGRIRDAMRASGRERNTLFIVTSDNGADRRGSPGPLRGLKQQTFEGGMRVPLIAAWPNHLPAGQVRGGMGMIFDLMPTVLEIASAPLPTDRIIDGRNLMDLWHGRTGSPHNLLFYTNAWTGQAEAVRDARFKYRAAVFDQLFHPFYPADFAIPVTDPPMLTDLDRDNETHDLSSKQVQAVDKLRAALEEFRRSSTENPRGWR